MCFLFLLYRHHAITKYLFWEILFQNSNLNKHVLKSCGNDKFHLCSTLANQNHVSCNVTQTGRRIHNLVSTMTYIFSITSRHDDTVIHILDEGVVLKSFCGSRYWLKAESGCLTEFNIKGQDSMYFEFENLDHVLTVINYIFKNLVNFL